MNFARWVRPLHIRGLRGRRSTPTAEVFDSHENTSQQHKDIGQDDHHRVDRDRLLGHIRYCCRDAEGVLRRVQER